MFIVKEKRYRTCELVLLLIYPIIASIISLLLNVNALGSILLFLVIPSVFLSFLGKKHIKKSLIFTALISIPAIIIIECLANSLGAWFVPFSIVSFRLFGYVSIEALFWAFFLVYYIVMFYEYFLDKHMTKKLWHPYMKYLAMLVLIALSVFLVLFFNFPMLLNIPYFYLSFGTVLILIPILIQLFDHPRLSAKFFKAGAYFFFMTFIYEVTSLKLGLVAFPGAQFIGWISIFGVKFPVEELFFWCMLFAMAVLSYYEFFDDDEK